MDRRCDLRTSKARLADSSGTRLRPLSGCCRRRAVRVGPPATRVSRTATAILIQ